jgi:hypothetical protein
MEGRGDGSRVAERLKWMREPRRAEGLYTSTKRRGSQTPRQTRIGRAKPERVGARPDAEKRAPFTGTKIIIIKIYINLLIKI